MAHSLPLHICDIAGLMAGLAIQTRNRLARLILHFWGLALSSQAFLFPVLDAGPVHSDFWLYWIEHGAIVVAAVYDMTVRGYRPGWRQWRRAVLALAIYGICIAPFDGLLRLNYGYLGDTVYTHRSVVMAFGRWPARVPALWLASSAAMALLLILRRWPARNAITPEDHTTQLMIQPKPSPTARAA